MESFNFHVGPLRTYPRPELAMDTALESREKLLHHFRRFHAGEPLVEALEFVAEAFVFETECVENGGVEVADVDGVINDVI